VFIERNWPTACVLTLLAWWAGAASPGAQSSPPAGERAPAADVAGSASAERIAPELEEAARQGSAGAQWKLGRQHAEHGDHARALIIFRELAQAHLNAEGDGANARILADTYVRLSHYYLAGIPGAIPPDPAAAQRMLEYAASYFRDPQAQYELGRLLLGGENRSPVQAARWLLAAARKDHRQAQALLGDLLIKGDGVPRQPGFGLFWLALAADGDPDDGIKQRYAAALAQTSAQEHALAFQHLEDWVKNQRQ
jgi:uncharacterized protein